MLTNQERLILLNLIPDVGSTRLRRLLDAFGDLERLFRATVQELQRVEGIGAGLAERIASGTRDERRLEREMALAKEQGVTILSLEDAEYPQPLRTIHDPPLALYVRGTLSPADEMAVAIVGARRASLYGMQSAERLGYDLSLRGVTVVSGLARGIDSAAHRGALKAGGRTLAVLGSGMSRLYPPEHTELADEVARHGALLSEYPMEVEPLPHNFPRRNRLISGLSLGVVVVEAAQRSGALITADCALEQGREVFAVPGPMTAVTSQGTHHLLKQGARLVTSVEDILEELRLSPQPVGVSVNLSLTQLRTSSRDPRGTKSLSKDQTEALAPSAHRGDALAAQPHRSSKELLSEPERRVFACLDALEPLYIDAIASSSGMVVAEVSSALLQLELKSLIRQLPGKQFLRKK